MISVYVSVEGYTETEFCSQVLAPYFLITGKNISITPVSMRGNVSLVRASSEVKKLLRCRNCDIVTTLYDLYGFKKPKDSKNCTKQELEKALEDEIKDPYKFIPYIQQYEFEALLFSDPITTSEELGSPQVASKLSEIVEESGNAEKINDKYETCPSRRLKKIFPRFDKTLHGPNICEKTGIDRIREKCAGFNNWIEKIEELAQKKTITST